MKRVLICVILYVYHRLPVGTILLAKAQANDGMPEGQKQQRRQAAMFDHRKNTPMFVLKDMRIADHLVPVHSSEPAIIFWRPQKVGSSTILSLLVSYGYRYNVLVRRKSAFNSLCIKAARCALEDYDTLKRTLGQQESFSAHSLQIHLTKYVEDRLYGAGKPRMHESYSCIVIISYSCRIHIIKDTKICALTNPSPIMSYSNALLLYSTLPILTYSYLTCPVHLFYSTRLNLLLSDLT